MHTLENMFIWGLILLEAGFLLALMRFFWKFKLTQAVLYTILQGKKMLDDETTKTVQERYGINLD